MSSDPPNLYKPTTCHPDNQGSRYSCVTVFGFVVNYDCWRLCQCWTVPEEEDLAFLEDSYDFGAGPQGDPCFPKLVQSSPPQADLEQQCGHLWQDGQKTTDLHRKNLSEDLLYL